MTLDRRLGEKLRQAREEADQSLVRAASLLDVTEIELKEIEAGAVRIASRIVHRAAQAFDVEIRWFFEQTSDEVKAHEEKSDEADPRALILQKLRSNQTLSKLCGAVRESDYTGKSQRFVA